MGYESSCQPPKSLYRDSAGFTLGLVMYMENGDSTAKFLSSMDIPQAGVVVYREFIICSANFGSRANP